MSTAANTIADALVNKGCLGKAADDEPVFVLRAKDAVSIGLIEQWIRVVEAARGPTEKTREARKVVVEFERWQYTNREIVRMPD